MPCQYDKIECRTRQRAEVAWYRQHGKHHERIVREYSGNGEDYVVGDWSWARLHPR